MKNKQLTKIINLLNTAEKDKGASNISVVEEIMKFTRIRRGGRILTSAKKAIWKNELNNLSNAELQTRFEKKMELFVESRLSHLKHSKNPVEKEFGNKIEASINLAFKQFIGSRLIGDMNSLTGDTKPNKVIQTTPQTNDYFANAA
jgi:hypothetical protein